MIKAVLFDMDNVIVDSEEIHLDAEEILFLKHNITRDPKEVAKYSGVKDDIMFDDFIKKHNVNSTPEEMMKQKWDLLHKALNENTIPIKGVIELIKKFKEKGLKLAVVSSSYENIVMLVLNNLNIKDYFNVIVTGSDNLKSKPSPECFLEAAKRLNTAPEECLVIEDAEHGVEAAKSAGMKCVGFVYPKGYDQDISKADIIVDDFRKLDLEKALKN